MSGLSKLHPPQPRGLVSHLSSYAGLVSPLLNRLNLPIQNVGSDNLMYPGDP